MLYILCRKIPCKPDNGQCPNMVALSIYLRPVDVLKSSSKMYLRPK